MTIYFWLSTTGVEYIWRKWDLKTTHKWEGRNKENLSPGGKWEKHPAGFYLQSAIDKNVETIMNLITWFGRKGSKNIDIRKLFSMAEETEMVKYPGPMLTLANLCSGFNPETLWPLKKNELLPDDDLKIFWFWSHLCRVDTVPLPCSFNYKFGWLVKTPDEVSAACWELAFLVSHGLRPRICENCQKGLIVKGNKCHRCKGKRQHTPESRLRNLLAQYVRRGKITDRQRTEIKSVLKRDGLFIAKRELEKVLGRRN